MVSQNYTYSLSHIPSVKYLDIFVEEWIHHTEVDNLGKGIFVSMISGTSKFFYDYKRCNKIKIFEKVIEYKVNTFCSPLTIHRFLIKENIEDYIFSSISYVTNEGEPLPPKVSKRFKDIYCLTIKERFVQAETAFFISKFILPETKLKSIGKASLLFDL